MDPPSQQLFFRSSLVVSAQPIFEDSFYVPSFLQSHLGLDPDELLKVLMDQGPWTNPADPEFRYRGKELPRQKCFLVRADDGIPKYAYPGFQYASMEHYRPLSTVPDVETIADELQQFAFSVNPLPVVINHVIGTRYRGAHDNIGYHSDKVDDITPNSRIISVSLGEPREMHIGNPVDPKTTIFERAIALFPGDVFILGPVTNARHRHSIVKVNQEKGLIRRDGDMVRPRISLVFRDICTTIDAATKRKRARFVEERE